VNRVATAPRPASRRGIPASGWGSLPQNQFRTDIEGLRAVAVVAVVLFHAGLPGVGGGFIGVDVFFVVSGFLITGLLWREASGTGMVRLARFYGARARRLLPAAVTVLVATCIASAVLLPPLQARSVIGDGIASALYVGNYRFAIQGTAYLAADAPPSPMQPISSGRR
jgi:peptidoglycan/LPS O-acetylase OafA/YrhL